MFKITKPSGRETGLRGFPRYTAPASFAFSWQP